MDFKRVTYFELFRRAETSARVSAPKLRKRFWNLVTVIFGVPKKSKLAITQGVWMHEKTLSKAFSFTSSLGFV